MKKRFRFIRKLPSVYQAYVNNTDQKEILSSKIIAYIGSMYDRHTVKEFTYSDVGAADGKVSIPVINELKDRYALDCHIIEPSKLIRVFKSDSCFERINYVRRRIEQIELAFSDFILASHIFIYLDNPELILEQLFFSLKSEGSMLIVETHPESDDVKLKRAIGREKAAAKNINSAKDIINWLKSNGIRYDHEIVESRIRTEGCREMNAEGEAIISFFYNRPFNKLSLEQIELCREKILELSGENDRMIKKEEYIWIYKS